MSRNARLRKLRREAQRQLGAHSSSESVASKSLRDRHSDSILVPISTGEKMSEVLEEFAAPLLEGVDSPEELKKALVIAMIAWNYSLLDEARRAEPDAACQALCADPVGKEVLERLLIRKQELFPDNHRAILDFELIPNGTEFRFNVISTLDPGRFPGAIPNNI
jgi:hypothetical protein